MKYFFFRDVPFSALYWPLYEGTKKLFEKKMLLGHDAFVINFLSGAAAGTVASTITLPFDVVKTTKQIELGETMIGGGSTGFSSYSFVKEFIY